MSFVYCIGIFFAMLIVQSMLHRYLLRRKVMTIKTVFIHIIGLGALGVLWRRGIVTLPVSSFLLYILAWLTISDFYLGLTLGGETPASMILSSYQKKKRQTQGELQRLFTTHGLIWKRIDDLVTSGLVKRRGDRLVATRRGSLVAWGMRIYKTIFHRTISG